MMVDFLCGWCLFVCLFVVCLFVCCLLFLGFLAFCFVFSVSCAFTLPPTFPTPRPPTHKYSNTTPHPHTHTQKAATIATATVAAISDLNAKHRITERAGNAALSALDWTTQMAQQYLSGREQNAAATAGTGAGAIAAAPSTAAAAIEPAPVASVSTKPVAFHS